MADKLTWGIIGAGNIAKAFARGVAASKTGTLLAVGSRTQAKADEFGAAFNVPRRYGSYESLLADRDVQAVYVATPHPMHAEWAIKAADAGKHILCEKPIGLNHAEAMAIVEAACRNNVFLMEAFMYRCHPQTRKLVELLREKVIGDVRVIQATFSFQAGSSPTGRLFAQSLGGGGILDVGGYCTSMARLIAGAATGKDFAEPIEMKASGVLGQTGTDDYAVAVAKFPGNIVATLATGVVVTQENVVRIHGSEGSIFVPSPWIPAREGGATKIIVQKRGEKEPREIVVETEVWLYGLEADTVAEGLDRRQAAPPAMTWDDTLGNMKMLDQWREGIGLVYDSEKPEAVTYTVSRRPLAKKPGSTMKYGRVQGIDRPISRLIMGVNNQRNMPHAAVMFDDFIERGGNCFDTAHIYASGLSERLLGQWIKNRGIRSEVLILGKGAHTPYCNPADLTKQLLISLERLQTDHIDLYMMHRDNLDVPVGEFVEVLNEHQKAGRIRAFGGSNWTLARVDAANAYARTKGLTPFAAVSNNFSLARMVDAPWAGCLAASDPESRAWCTRTQTPLMSWSSQGRGFFLPGKADPKDLSDKELVRCWYAEDNFRRLARAKELAGKRGALPINIALAYVLCQPFPTFALIGPRVLAETRTSWPALDIELTPDDLAWLNLER